MRLTTRRCYAVMAMLDVALYQDKGPVSLVDISQRHNISQSYLEQLFSKLRKNKLVKSVRGPGGGYVINKDLEQLTVAEVISAIDDAPLKLLQCNDSCGCIEHCVARVLWSRVSQLVHNYLNKVTYADLIRQCKAEKIIE